MAEEEKQVTETKVEVVEGQTQVTPKLSASEEKATGLGWMPKDEWVESGKDAEDWKPAKVFLEHGDMIGKIRAQSRELDETRQALRFMNDKNKQVYEKGYQTAITELRVQKRAALAEGDLVKADQIDEKIDATKEELDSVRRTPPPTPRQVDPEHEQWIQRNQWYNESVMQKFADALAIEYIRVNNGQVGPSQVRDFVEQEVKKEFPHKFTKTNGVQGAPNPDGEGRGTGKKPSSGLDSKLAKAKAEMTDEQRGIMKNIMRSTGLSEAKYLEMYLS